ncbi:MAG TPA: hypothetical protein VK525_06885 [Candidatus Saccharimonadales bacterium]|nr:hypothetical protein [Candidatus Saccharimonadales bacterium]
MRGFILGMRALPAIVMFTVSVCAASRILAQESPQQPTTATQSADQKIDVSALNSVIRQLQSQMQELGAQLKELKAQQQSSQAESAALRKELELTKSQLALLTAQPAAPAAPASATAAPPAPPPSTEERLAHLEENQQLADSKAAEQSQTKVESASKYRMRLSGIVLLNTYFDRGNVDNQDFPQLALAPFESGGQSFSSAGTFGATLRQSQVGLQVFGPDIAGAHTSADIKFDFAGGFPLTPNGVSSGIARLRTGTIRFDWASTSVIAGQDSLFISPLSPSSIATLATPPLSYAGNLWSWTPQIRVEHTFKISDTSAILLQGAILDSFSGDVPFNEYTRSSTWGEDSGQPAYAARVSVKHRAFGQDLVFGVGGYYGRQTWGFDRHVDGWASTFDLLLPLGHLFEFKGQFYRGRAVGGLGGGLEQSVLWNGSLLDPATTVRGVNSMGGWAQLKFKPTLKFEINGALGVDNPFAQDLRGFNGSATYNGQLFSKNLSPFVNFIYQPRSDIVFSLEYRRIKSFAFESTPNAANQVNLSVGYIF